METNKVLQSFLFLVFSIAVVSDSSIADKPPSQAIWQNGKLDRQDNQILFSSSEAITQRDDIPIVNPTTPGTGTQAQPNPNPNPNPTTPAVGGAWCIVSPTAAQTAIQVALDYACGYGGADCSAVQPGGTCYNPNTLRDHASYAFNDYYQKNPIPTSCVFGGTAQITNTDPSNGNCHFASSPTTPTMMPPTTPIMMPPTIPAMTPPIPPSTTSPVNPMTPIGPNYGTEPTDYGGEPTETPSSANSIVHNVVMLFITTSIVVFLQQYF